MSDSWDMKEPNPSVSFLGGVVQIWSTFINRWYLIQNLVRKDLKSRYSQASIGYGWIFLEPLMLSAVYYVLFSMIANRPEENYSLYVIIGVIVWGHFGKTLQATIGCLTSGGNMIKQIYFPREILAFSPVITQLWISTLSLTAVIPVMIWLKVMPSSTVWMVPFSLILATMLAMGIGLIFAPLNAISKDITHLFRFIIRAGFFLSPVMWTYEMMIVRAPGNWVDMIMLNPMVIPLTFARHGLDGAPLDIEVWYVTYSIGFAVVSLFFGLTLFKKWEARVVKYL
jgi:ABC-type polysaccharide/polyol phosphate export permease